MFDQVDNFGDPFLAIIVLSHSSTGHGCDGKSVSQNVYIYIYIYIFRIILHFIIFLLSDPSSSSRKHPHHPFCPSVLASWESTHHVRCESRCEVVVTCQMIVTSHGGSPMSCIELKGGEITERNTCSTGSWQIYCWTMVFMYSSYMILI